MKNLLEFVKTTLLGGLVVILPATVIFVLLERAVVTVRAALEPLASYLPSKVFLPGLRPAAHAEPADRRRGGGGDQVQGGTGGDRGGPRPGLPRGGARGWQLHGVRPRRTHADGRSDLHPPPRESTSARCPLREGRQVRNELGRRVGRAVAGDAWDVSRLFLTLVPTARGASRR